jgi:hypothetical protein
MQLYERRLESSLHKTRAELQKLQAARKAEEKAREKSAPAGDQGKLKKQSQSPGPGRKSETRATQGRGGDLKKQSQFAAEQIDASSCDNMDYDDMPHPEPAENKPGQGQFRTQGQPRRAVKPESPANVRARQ